MDFGFQNPKSPRSKIQNHQRDFGSWGILDFRFSGRNPKSKIHQSEIWGHIKICYITVQNPKSPKSAKKVWILDFGLGDFGFWISPPKSKIPKIQNPKSPKSKLFWPIFLGFWILDFGPLCSKSLCGPKFPGGHRPYTHL